MCFLDDGLCGPPQTHTDADSLCLYCSNKHMCCNVPTYLYGAEEPPSPAGS